jgi:hypothetical protein
MAVIYKAGGKWWVEKPMQGGQKNITSLNNIYI